MSTPKTFIPDQPKSFIPDDEAAAPKSFVADEPAPIELDPIATAYGRSLMESGMVDPSSDRTLAELQANQPSESERESARAALLAPGRTLDTSGRVIKGALADTANLLVGGEAITPEAPFENISAGWNGEEMPVDKMTRLLPGYQQVAVKGLGGLAESAPRLALMSGMTAGGMAPAMSGGLSFGISSDKAIDPKQAVIGAILPEVGKYSGAIVEAVAKQSGVQNATAAAVLNHVGQAFGSAGVVGADGLVTISRLPPEQRPQAWIDFSSNVGTMLIMGMMGERVSKLPEGRFKDLVSKVALKRDGTSYSASEVKDIYRRANTGEATPEELNLVRQINSELEAPGQALRQGVTTSQTEARIAPEFFKSLGIEGGGSEISLGGTSQKGKAPASFVPDKPSASQPTEPRQLPNTPPAAAEKGTPVAPPATLYEHGLQRTIDELTAEKPPLEEPSNPEPRTQNIEKPKPLATVADVLGEKMDVLNQMQARLEAEEKAESGKRKAEIPDGTRVVPRQGLSQDKDSPGPATENVPPSDAEAFIEQIAPATETKATPAELAPALRTKEGRVIEGTRGQTHRDIYDAQPGTEGLMLRTTDPEHGFVRNGTFLSREQAAQALGETTPLQSERLRDLQRGPAVESKTSEALKSAEFHLEGSERTAKSIREQIARDRRNLDNSRRLLSREEIKDEERRINGFEVTARDLDRQAVKHRQTIASERARLAKVPDQFSLPEKQNARPGDASEATRAEQPIQTGKPNQPPVAQPVKETVELRDARRAYEQLPDKASAAAGRLRQKIQRLGGTVEYQQADKPVRVSRGRTAKSRFNNETDRVGQDLLAWVADNMRIMSKSEARKRRGAEWFRANSSMYDGAPQSLPGGPHHNVIYGGSSMPDQVAEGAFREGLINEATPDALWTGLHEASAARKGMAAADAKDNARLDALAQEHQNWLKAVADGKQGVAVDDLMVGDVMDVEGERVKVIEKDERTGVVTLQDGRKFGRQEVAPGTMIYVENVEGIEGGEPSQFVAGELREEPGNPDTWNLSDDDVRARLKELRERAGDLTAAETKEFNDLRAEWTERNRKLTPAKKGAELPREATQPPPKNRLPDQASETARAGRRQPRREASPTEATDLAGALLERADYADTELERIERERNTWVGSNAGLDAQATVEYTQATALRIADERIRRGADPQKVLTDLQEEARQADIYHQRTGIGKATEDIGPAGSPSHTRAMNVRRADGLRYAAETLSDLIQQFGAGTQRTMFTPGAGPVWRDNILDALESWQNKGTPEQLMAHLAKTRGAMDEAEWIGLRDFIKDKPSVTKEQVAAFVRANQVQVEEVQNGISQADEDRLTELFDREQSGDMTEAEFAEQEYLQERAKRSETKFANYQLPGGENYRELLLTLPDRNPFDVDAYNKATSSEDRERIRNAPRSEKFHSTHFNEPNIVAHVRFNERTFADGVRGIFLEENQSDWHQKGRKEGYRGESLPAASEAEIELKRIDRTPDQNPKIYPGYWESFDKRDGRMIMRHGGNMNRQEAIKEAVQYAHYHAQEEASKSVPNAPFKQTWPMLAMKRMIRYAAENGFERIAWTTGEQQAERYDLSKQVDAIRATRNSDGTYKISTKFGANKDIWQSVANDVAGAKLDEYVGKDLAKKITEQPDDMAVYSGLDLKVGGEGMKGFYDKILPTEVNKFVKKWGGKVGTAEVVTRPETQEDSPITGDDSKVTLFQTTATVHSLDITPAMKAAAMQGMPLFAAPGKELTPDAAQQTIRKAIHEKHQQSLLHQNQAGADHVLHVARGDAEFTRVIRQSASHGQAQVWTGTEHARNFYATPAGQRLSAAAQAAGYTPVYFNGPAGAPKGAFNGRSVLLRANVPETELAGILEHEVAHGAEDRGHREMVQLVALVNLNSHAAKAFRQFYDGWLRTADARPLTDAETRGELAADFVAGRNMFPGIQTAEAFHDPDHAQELAEDYHSQASRNSAGEFSFDAPESVGDQKARVAAEAKQKAEADKLAERKAFVARGGERLTGDDVDTTSEMFGADVQVDKAGQGSLFAPGTPKTAKELIDTWESAHKAFVDVIGLKWVRNRPKGMTSDEAHQAISLAAAKLRIARDELLANEEYLGKLMKKISKGISAGDDQITFEPWVNELNQANPKLVAKVRADMIARGVIPDTKPTPLEYGRKLDELTDWLQNNTVESPGLNLADRLNLVQEFKERVQNIKDGVDYIDARLAVARKAFVDQYKAPPTDTPFRSLFKNWKFNDEWTGQEIHAWRKAFKEQVPNPIRRAAITVWIDAGGDQSLLKMQRDAVPDRYLPVWKAATSLTPTEQALARQIVQNLARMKDDGLNSGLIENAREEYGMPQVWLKPPELSGASSFAEEGSPGKAGNPTAKLDPRNPFFSFRRETPSYFEGIMAKGIPKGLDAAELISHYHAAFHKSLNSRAFIAAARNEKAADGKPLVVISGQAQEVPLKQGGRGYVVNSGARPMGAMTADGRPYMSVDHWAMKDWKMVYRDPAGKPILVRGDMLVHPDHYDFLKNELGESALREGMTGRLMRPVFASNAFLKASKLALAGFHMLTIAEHMASHLQAPWTSGFKIDLRDPTQALLTRHGLELGMAGQHAAFMEGVASHGGLFKQLPGLGSFMANFSDWMFADYIPTIMMKVGVDSFKRNLKRYSNELTRDQIAELTATQMNAGSGLPNYRQMGRNKTIMDISRLTLLAPMFLEARGRVLAQAFKPYHAEQRRLLLVQALALFVAARILNALLDGDPHWEERNWFRVVHNGRAYGLRTIVGDLFHLINDPNSFAAGRLSPVTRTAIEAGTGKDLRTGANINTYFDNKLLRTGEIIVRDLASWLAPVGVEGLLPNATGKETTIPSALMTSVGIGSQKETSNNRVYELARDFNQHGDPQAQDWQKQRDMEIRGESAYRKLDNLLEAGHTDQARAEYNALVEHGHSPENIANRFLSLYNPRTGNGRPFTGTIEREKQFIAQMNEHQRAVYLKAIDERKARVEQFARMIQAVPVSK